MSSFDDTPHAPWSLSTHTLYKALSTGLEGLSAEEAQERKKRIGANRLKEETGINTVRIFLKQILNPLAFVLFGAALLTALLSEWVDTGIILLAACVNIGLGFFQEYRAEHTLKNLKTFVKDHAHVIRGGNEKDVDAEDLVPGDIIRLSFGSRIPGDARVISSTNLSVDESILSGESLPISKRDTELPVATILPERVNMLFAGTLVVEGTGTAIVTHTGTRTEIGKIAKLLADTKNEQTPLEKTLSEIGWIIFGIVVIVTLIIVGIGIVRGETIIEMLLIASAVAVGAIPEALPTALTVILAIGVERIAKKKGIIRQLSAAETLGAATLVMVDKTGTLTEARMELVSILSKKELKGVEGNEVHKEAHREMLERALSSSDVAIENPEDAPSAWRLIGRAIEQQVARSAHSYGVDVPSITAHRRLVLPFNSTNKFSIGYLEEKKSYTVFGAPDIVLSRSDVSKDELQELLKKIDDISEDGKRVLGIARIKDGQARVIESHGAKAEYVKNLEFLGVLVLYDPVRKDVPKAIRRIEEHGVRVVMVTGDLKGTAMSVARELGWDVSPDSVLSGADIAGMKDEELKQRLRITSIFCRMTPEDKLRIARLFQSQGEVVAMTGDGVNDAPSLKAADVGVALGSGSDVAKSAADLVLLDNGFSVIVHAIEEGRRIIANIRKTFVYLLINALDEVVLIGGALIAGFALPLTALQIIWVNFFVGSLPAIAYAFEKNRDVGVRGSKNAGKTILDGEVKALVFGVGAASSLLLFLFYSVLVSTGMEHANAQSIVFLCFSSYVLAIAFSLKSLRRPLFSYPLFDNVALTGGVLLGAVLVAVSVLYPPVRDVLELVEVPLYAYGLLLGWVVLNLSMVEGVKWWFSRMSRMAA